MKKPFIEPNLNPWVAGFVDLAYPLLLKLTQNIDEIVISKQDRELLSSLRNDRLLFFTNHPTAAEPPITWYLANIIGDRFHYMASRQVFDWWGGLLGNIIAAGGAFSVIAGISDRPSLKKTREILAGPGGKMVIFPEGEPIGGENDELLPFQPGVAQLGFWGLQDARKRDPKADITVVPSFIKYTIEANDQTVFRKLNECMNQIERKLEIDAGHKNILRRFMTTGRILLERGEKTYGLEESDNPDFDYRLGQLRHRVLDGVAKKLKVTGYDFGADAIQKLRHLFALMELITIRYPGIGYDHVDQRMLEWAKAEVNTAYNFIVMKRDYLLSNPTAERFFEWLLIFESFATGREPRGISLQPSHLPRKAHVFVAEPFTLGDYEDAYRANRRAGVDKVLTRIREDMQNLLDNSHTLTHPLVAPYNLGPEPATL